MINAFFICLKRSLHHSVKNSVFWKHHQFNPQKFTQSTHSISDQFYQAANILWNFQTLFSISWNFSMIRFLYTYCKYIQLGFFFKMRQRIVFKPKTNVDKNLSNSKLGFLTQTINLGHGLQNFSLCNTFFCMFFAAAG
jgi:hypothetical protein